MGQRGRCAKRSILGLVSAMVAGVWCGTASADEGMWLLNRPPAETLKSIYSFEPTPEWYTTLQRSAVRFSGASGSFVSGDGLVMTNHHVGSNAIADLSTKERDLMRDGFLARTRAEELKCPGLELRVLQTIEDVTERIRGAGGKEADAVAADAARRKEIAAVETEAKERSGLRSEVVTLYRGGLYHLYQYKVFDDVRLVFAPESAAAAFGGDTDNFEYPRFCMDVAFFRVYENDQPYKPEHYLPVASGGAAEGDLVFSIGHPGRTRRQFTADHLRFIRDVSLPMQLQRSWRREVQLQTFIARSEENSRIASDDLLGVQNSRKSQTGLLDGMLTPQIMLAKQAEEATLRAWVLQDPERASKWGNAWQEISDAYNRIRTVYPRYVALGSGRSPISSDLFNYAFTIVRHAQEMRKPSGERLREFREAALPALERSIMAQKPIYPELEVNRIESGLKQLAEMLGADDPVVMEALAGLPPRARAIQVVQGTGLWNPEERKLYWGVGPQALSGTSDSLIQLAMVLDEPSRAMRRVYEETVEAVETKSYAAIAEARWAMRGDSAYPDATGTLRLSLGQVLGYDEGDQLVPTFTTLGGLFERAEARGTERAEFRLPDRWIQAKNKLNLNTPYNFVAALDTVGGNSGSPVVNRDGQVVGLLFDGNIYSLIRDVVYDQSMARSIMVDPRGIAEVLRVVYGAEALADEFTGVK